MPDERRTTTQERVSLGCTSVSGSPGAGGRIGRCRSWYFAISLSVTIGVAAPVQALPGDIATKFRVNDDDPMASVPTVEERNADPLEFANYLQDMIARAEGAVEAREWERAIKYYEALAKAVPDRAVSFSRLCVAYGELGKFESGARNCLRATQLGGARVIDHLRFIDFTLRKSALSPRDLGEIEASLAHLRAHLEDRATKSAPGVSPAPSADVPRTREQIKADFLKKREARLLSELHEPERRDSAPPVHLPTEIESLSCRVAVRLRDAERLDRCTAALRALHVDEKLIVSFEWARALIRGDWAQADALLESARRAGFTDVALAAMTQEQREAREKAGMIGLLRRWAPSGLAGAGVIALVVFALRRRVSAAARRRKLQAASGASAS